MKLHLPKGLRTAVLACFAAFAGIGTTLTTATITGGVFAVSMASQAMAVEYSTDTTVDSALGSEDVSITGGTTTVTYGNGSATGFTTGNVTVGAGATLALDGSDSIGYDGGKTPQITLTGDASNVATLSLGQRQTTSTNIVLGGNAAVVDGAAAESEKRGALNPFGGTLTANGDNNTIYAGIALRRNYEFIVNGSLNISGGIWQRADQGGEVATFSKSGTGTLTIDAVAAGAKYDTDANSQVFSPWWDTSKSYVGLKETLQGFEVKAGAVVINRNMTVGNLTVAKDATFTSNAALTLQGTLKLGEGVTINLGTAGTLAVADGFKIDLSEMSATTEGGVTTYTLLTGTNASLAGLNLTHENITGVDASGSWAFLDNGTITFTAGETITYSTDTTVTWTATGTGAGVFTNGDSVVVAAGVADVTLGGSLEAYDVTVEDGATLNIAEGDSSITMSTLTNHGTLTVGSDVTVGVYDYGDGDTGIGTISVAAGKTLTITELGYYDTDDTYDALNLWNVFLSTQSDSAGTVVFAGDVSGWADHSLNDTTIVAGFKIDGSVKFNRGGHATNVTIGSGNGRLYATKDINLSNSQNWTVQGVLTSGGTLSVGHDLADERYNGTLTVDGGTVTANKLHLYTTASWVKLNSGRLNIGSEGITVASGKTPTITLAGGTLGATADWTAATAITVTGGVTVDTTKQTVSSIGIASTPAEGAEAATIRLTSGLTATGEAAKLKVDGNGKLVLGGTVTLSNAIELGANAALELAANTVLDLSAMDSAENNTYTLLTGEGTTNRNLTYLASLEGLRIVDTKLTSPHVDWTFNDDGTISYVESAYSVWAGGDATWTTTKLTGTDGNETAYTQGSYIDFTGTEAAASTVVLGEDISAKAVVIYEGAQVTLTSDESGSYKLSVTQGIELAGELTIQGDVLDTSTKLILTGDKASLALDGTTADYSDMLSGYTGALTLKNTSMDFSASEASALRSLTLGTGGAAAISGDGATAAVKLAGGNLTLSNYHQFKGSVELIGSSTEENVGTIISGANLAALSCDVTGTGSLALQGGANGGGLLLRGTLGFKGNLTLAQAADDRKQITLDGGKLENEGNVTVESAEVYASSAANINNKGTLAVVGGKLLLNSGSGVGENVTGLSLTGGTFATKEAFAFGKETTLGAVTLGGVDGYTGTITLSGATTFAGTVTNNGTLALSGTLAIDETAAAAMASSPTYSDTNHAGNGFLTATYTLVNGGTVTGITTGTTKVTLGSSQLDAKWDSTNATLTATGTGTAYYVNNSSEYTAENSSELSTATSVVINNATLTLTDASVFTQGVATETDTAVRETLLAGDANASFVMKGIAADYTGVLADYTGAVTVTGAGAKLSLSKDWKFSSLTVADGAALSLANGVTYNQDRTITLDNGEIELQWNDLLGNLKLLDGGGTISLSTTRNAILGATVKGSGALTLEGEGETLGLKSAEIANDSTVTLKGSILIGRDAASSLLNKGKVTVAEGATVVLDSASSIANKDALEISTGGKLTAYAGTTLDNEGDVSVLGTLTTSTAITSKGKVTVGNGGLVTLNSGSSLANGGALEIAHGGTLTQEAGASITATDIKVGGTLNVTSALKGADGFKLTIAETTVDEGTEKGQICISAAALENWAEDDQVSGYSAGNSNGFKGTIYTLVSGASNATISSGAQVTVGEKGYDLTQADGADTITFAIQGTEYYVTTGTVDYSTISTAAATGVVLNGGTLAIAETDTSIVPVSVKENSMVNLAANAALAASGVTIASEKTLTLGGSGLYTVTNASQLTGFSAADAGWTGTVVLDGSSGVIDTSGSVGGINLANLGNANSKVELKAVKGYIVGATNVTTTYANALKLTNSAYGAALVVSDGYVGSVTKFTGEVSGDGNIVRTTANGAHFTYAFSGDVSGWDGHFRLADNAGETTVRFDGSATAINADLVGDASTLHVQIDNNDAVAVNGAITGSADVTYLGAGTKTISGKNTYSGGTTIGSSTTNEDGSITTTSGGTVVATTNDSLGTGLTTVIDGTLKLESGVTTLAGGVSLADAGLLVLDGSKYAGSISNTDKSRVQMMGASSISGLEKGQLTVNSGATASSTGDITVSAFTNDGKLDLGTNNLTITTACATGGDVTAATVTTGGDSVFTNLKATTLHLGGTLKATTLDASLTRIELTQPLDAKSTPLTVTNAFTGKALTFALTTDLLPAAVTNQNDAATYTTLLATGSALDENELKLTLDVTAPAAKALAENSYQHGVTLYTLMVQGNNVVLKAEFHGTVWNPTGSVADWEQTSSDEFGGNADDDMPLDANLMFAGGGTENGAGTVNVSGTVTADSVTVDAAGTSYTFSGKDGTAAVIDITLLEVDNGNVTFTDVTVGAKDDPLATVEVAATGSLTVDDGASLYAQELTDASTTGLSIKAGGMVSVGDGSDINKLVNDGAFEVTSGTATVDALSGSGAVTVAKDATLAVTSPAAGAGTALSIGALGGEGTLNATGWDVTQTSASTGGHVVAKSLTAVSGSTLNSLNVAESLTLNLADLADGTSLLTLTDAVPGATGSMTINVVAADDALLTGSMLGVGEYTLVSLTGAAAGAYTFTGLDALLTDARQQEYALAGLYASLTETADGLVFSVVEDDPRYWQGGDVFNGTVDEDDKWAGSKDNGYKVLDLSQLTTTEALDSVDVVEVTKDTVINVAGLTHDDANTDGLVLNHLTGAADLTLKGGADDLATLNNVADVENGLGDSSYSGKLTVEGMQVNVAGDGESVLDLAEVALQSATFSVQESGLVVVDSITGDAASTIGGIITVDGAGTDYSGSYNGATIQLADGASVKLVAKSGLSITDLPVTTFAAGTKSVVLDCTAAPAEVDAIHVSNTDITLDNVSNGAVNTLTVTDTNSTMTGGTLTFSVNANSIVNGGHDVITTGLTLDGTTVVANQVADVKDATFKLDKTEGVTLFTLAGSGITLDDIDTENGTFFTGAFFNRYFDASSLTVDAQGNVKADLVTDYYTSKLAQTENGAAGLEMLDKVELLQNPQSGDLADLLDSLAGYTPADASAADKLGAAVAGSGVASLGMALAGDVERQLKAIRNRTTTMGVDPAVVNEDMPYFNAWINAEGDHRSLDEDGTLAGYTLSSWGGTVGFDMDVTPELTWGLAVTAMYGDFSAESADVVEGDMETYYVSAFARATSGAWVHTFVATMGMSTTELTRTVSHANGSYTTQGDADGLSFGLMYEVARTFALNEDASACWQPVFNVTYRHTEVDGYTETGSDAALKVGDQSLDTVTFGLGGRLQAIVGENIYNRTSIFEARALVKLDAGDRESEMDTALLALPGHGSTVKSAEMDAFGVELGAGLTIPMGMESGSLFIDGSVEFRGSYTSANGTLGYRFNF